MRTIQKCQKPNKQSNTYVKERIVETIYQEQRTRTLWRSKKILNNLRTKEKLIDENLQLNPIDT